MINFSEGVAKKDADADSLSLQMLRAMLINTPLQNLQFECWFFHPGSRQQSFYPLNFFWAFARERKRFFFRKRPQAKDAKLPET